MNHKEAFKLFGMVSIWQGADTNFDVEDLYQAFRARILEELTGAIKVDIESKIEDGIRESINDAIENAEVRDLVRRFKAAHVELVNSQSKDRATGIFEHDRSRLEALIENARGIIAFGENSVDLPENPADTPAV